MAIKVGGDTVISDALALNNIASIDSTTATAIGAQVGGGLDLSDDLLVSFGSSTGSSNTGTQPAGVYFLMAFFSSYFGGSSYLNIGSGTLEAALMWRQNQDNAYTSNWSNNTLAVGYGIYFKGFIHFSTSWRLDLDAAVGANVIKIYNIQ